MPGLAIMFLKSQPLRRKLTKTARAVSYCRREGYRIGLGPGQQSRGGKIEGFSHYVIENTCTQNVRKGLSHYVDENSGTYRALGERRERSSTFLPSL
jgi:hypothetical protein